MCHSLLRGLWDDEFYGVCASLGVVCRMNEWQGDDEDDILRTKWRTFYLLITITRKNKENIHISEAV